jgi:hypothetical protein
MLSPLPKVYGGPRAPDLGLHWGRDVPLSLPHWGPDGPPDHPHWGRVSAALGGGPFAKEWALSGNPESIPAWQRKLSFIAHARTFE